MTIVEFFNLILNVVKFAMFITAAIFWYYIVAWSSEECELAKEGNCNNCGAVINSPNCLMKKPKHKLLMSIILRDKRFNDAFK